MFIGWKWKRILPLNRIHAPFVKPSAGRWVSIQIPYRLTFTIEIESRHSKFKPFTCLERWKGNGYARSRTLTHTVCVCVCATSYDGMQVGEKRLGLVLSDLHERSRRRRRRWSLIFPSASLRIAIKFDDFLFFSVPPPSTIGSLVCVRERENMIGKVGGGLWCSSGGSH